MWFFRILKYTMYFLIKENLIAFLFKIYRNNVLQRW